MPDILSYLRSFRHLIHLPDGDGELLQRFRAKRDELAFATLVQRHGPMVLGVAQRILGQSEILDDVFQATFLVLAKRGRQMETWPSVAGWLVQVARRTALQARAKAARRTRHEQHAAAMTPTSMTSEPAEAVNQRDLSRLLDAELARLPSKYRTPLVLCHLEGQTKEETARQLGWPVGSVSGRLAQGKKLLQARLLRRGIVPALATSIFTMPAANAHLPSLLIQATTLLAANVVHQTSQVPTGAAVVLAQGVMTSMFMTKVKFAAAILLVLGLCLGTGAWAWTGQGEHSSTPVQTAKKEIKSESTLQQLQGLWMMDKIAVPPTEKNETMDRLLQHFWRFNMTDLETFHQENDYHTRWPMTVDDSLKPGKPSYLRLEKVFAVINLNLKDNVLLLSFQFSQAEQGKSPPFCAVMLRRFTDYDRLEGIWRKEERNPVTDEIDTAAELIFKKNKYVRRQFNKGTYTEDKPREFVLNETVMPKQLDWDIRPVAEVQEELGNRLRFMDKRNKEEYTENEIRRNSLIERNLGIYELTDNEFKYLISGAIPFTLENDKLVPNPKSPLNKRATSFAPGESSTDLWKGISVTYKRVERSMKENTGATPVGGKPENPRQVPSGNSDSTSAPPPQLQDLRQQRLKLAQERLKIWQIVEAKEAEHRKNFKSTTTFPLVHLDGLVVISQQVLDASLALATDKEARVKIMEEHLKVLKQIEDAEEQNGKQYSGSGSGFKDRTLAAKLRRIEFEIQLQELKEKR